MLDTGSLYSKISIMAFWAFGLWAYWNWGRLAIFALWGAVFLWCYAEHWFDTLTARSRLARARRKLGLPA